MPDDAEGTPGDIAEMLQAAEDAVQKLGADYLGWLQQDIEKIEALLITARDETGDRQPHLDQIYAVSHDVKGQGGSFGYDLVTEIGQSLCDLIKTPACPSDAGLDAIEAHIAALRRVAEDGLEGDGGDTGSALLTRLRQSVADLSG